MAWYLSIRGKYGRVWAVNSMAFDVQKPTAKEQQTRMVDRDSRH